MPGDLRVVATAGHVDHGKSALIVRLTGIDPDRFAEEKRRGLTIDLGYAWCTLPSGRDVGFVDVPGHERFISNMLAGVGPVRLVLFVVAADEGWKPQSEEHLQILDVLGVQGGVIALTKRDLVDAEMLEIATEDIRERLAGTALADSAIVPVSSVTGDGVDEIRAALDAMLDVAPPPEDARTRLFVDRVFTIRGAGTVVTGTLTGGPLRVGETSVLEPGGRRARIRGLQNHKRAEEVAEPVSRVAANLAGIERGEVQRGDVLTSPASWRPTKAFEAQLIPVRGLSHPITARGAFLFYAGAAEVSAKLRVYGAANVESGGTAFVRVRLAEPLVLDVFDRFVVRDAGRRETVAGGVVLDVAPPARPGLDPESRLARRAAASRDGLVDLLIEERGAVRRDDAAVLVGASGAAVPDLDGWLVSEVTRASTASVAVAELERYHAEHPLREGPDIETARASVARGLRALGVAATPELATALLDDLEARGVIVSGESTLRLTSHRVSLDDRVDDVERLLAAVEGERESTPPTLKELIAGGIARDVIDAATRAGSVVRVGQEFVFSAAFIARAEGIVRAAGDAGVTVSAFREALGTSRKYAVPLLEWFDQRGTTRRDGDRRVARER